ncbi:FAD-dependent monooxygenase [Microbispora hainanensis]|uniref:FAD-binding protein n=1 Tax=Microbispora hainanensis TaxID=568844 RepID=A0A544Z3W8_9ACTN|nr:FAD-dependent monooxygenase [Microbispora hainanensis]TQS23322.1 FAD-binding protein [Microbispora hainanensis]
MSARRESTAVLVVGGGVAGLSAAAFLAWHGVPCQVLERRSRLSAHPRARGFNPRAVELLRQIGLEPAVRKAGEGFADHTMRARVESLAGREVFRADLPTAGDLEGISPSSWALCSQDRLEPLIRSRAEDLGAVVRFGCEMESFSQDDDGVTVTLRDGGRMRARYLVAADGARSPMRKRLGIELKGTRALAHQLSIVFEADLRGPLGDRRFAICQVRNEQVDGLLVHDDTLRQGILYIQHPEPLPEYPEDRCVTLVRAAVGVPGLPVRILDRQSWELSALTATRYREGQVFLAGDAAHVMPPVGGFGASTGIQDAHNLAWKLAHVLRGVAGDALLDSYEAERGPVAELTVDQCLRRVRTHVGFGRPGGGDGLIDDLSLTFGYRYPAGALVEPDPRAPHVVDPKTNGAEIGVRAPHLELHPGGRSTLDLFGRGFTLMAGPAGRSWVVAAGRVAADLGVDIAAHLMTDDLVAAGAAEWCRRHGVGAGGAVLIRPDGIVGWRRGEAVEHPQDDVRAALRCLLSAGGLEGRAP